MDSFVKVGIDKHSSYLGGIYYIIICDYILFFDVMDIVELHRGCWVWTKEQSQKMETATSYIQLFKFFQPFLLEHDTMSLRFSNIYQSYITNPVICLVNFLAASIVFKIRFISFEINPIVTNS